MFVGILALGATLVGVAAAVILVVVPGLVQGAPAKRLSHTPVRRVLRKATFLYNSYNIQQKQSLKLTCQL